MEKKFDSKWLEGLKFHTADTKMVEKNGRKTLQAIPVEKPAKEEDILNWSDYGDKVVIALKDGMKYSVEKNPKPKAKEVDYKEARKPGV